jgi:hypothetical protein
LNNGKWLGGAHYEGGSGYLVELFQMDDANQPILRKTFSFETSVFCGKMLLDDIVLLLPTQVVIYEYDGTDWNQIQSFDVQILSGPSNNAYIFEYSIVTFNQSNQWVIWSRQTDTTYQVTNSYIYNSKFNTNMFYEWYNEVDTMVLT